MPDLELTGSRGLTRQIRSKSNKNPDSLLLAMTSGKAHVSEFQFHPCNGDAGAYTIGLAQMSAPHK